MGFLHQPFHEDDTRDGWPILVAQVRRMYTSDNPRHVLTVELEIENVDVFRHVPRLNLFR